MSNAAVDDHVPPAHRRHRPAAHRQLRQDADLHSVDDESVELVAEGGERRCALALVGTARRACPSDGPAWRRARTSRPRASAPGRCWSAPKRRRRASPSAPAPPSRRARRDRPAAAAAASRGSTGSSTIRVSTSSNRFGSMPGSYRGSCESARLHEDLAQSARARRACARGGGARRRRARASAPWRRRRGHRRCGRAGSAARRGWSAGSGSRRGRARRSAAGPRSGPSASATATARLSSTTGESVRRASSP